MPPDGPSLGPGDELDANGEPVIDLRKVDHPSYRDRHINRDEFDAAADRIKARWAEEAVADTPIWLSHHWPHEYDRCVRIGGRHVCRRCLVLYPMALACAALAGAGVSWPDRLDPWLCWLLPLPAVVEFVGEHLGVLQYRFRRQVLFTVLLAIACGKLYVRYLDDLRDPLAWSVVVVYGGVCLLASLFRAFRPPSDAGAVDPDSADPD